MLTHDEEDGANNHSPRQHMLRADLLGWFAHGAQLVGQWMSPKVGQQQGTEEEGDGAVAGTPWRLHLRAADGVDVKLQDHYGEDDHPERQDEGRPWFYFTLVFRQGEKTVSKEGKHIILVTWHRCLRPCNPAILTSVDAESTMTQGSSTIEETRLSRA